jgi:hypothetical protein
MSANLLRKKKTTTQGRRGLQPLLPLSSTDNAARVPDAARHRCLELLAELLKSVVVSAENNPTHVSKDEY